MTMEDTGKKLTSVSNCTFTGVQWDKEATEAVVVVAKALCNLTELFKSQNIRIEPMLVVHQEKE